MKTAPHEIAARILACLRRFRQVQKVMQVPPIFRVDAIHAARGRRERQVRGSIIQEAGEDPRRPKELRRIVNSQ